MITGLGHVGIFVRDLEKMVAFYRDFLGLRVTKQNWRAGTVFLSADPQAADHQIALVLGVEVGTVSATLAAAHQALRERLEEVQL